MEKAASKIQLEWRNRNKRKSEKEKDPKKEDKKDEIGEEFLNPDEDMEKAASKI